MLSVPLLVVVPLGLALLLNRSFPGRTFFRAVYFAPYVLGVAVIGLLWRFLLDANLGLVNRLAGAGRAARGHPLGDRHAVGLGLAGRGDGLVDLRLQRGDLPGRPAGHPAELYEAAGVDGANAWQRFRNVTLPGLRPVLLFVITTTVLASANMFGQSFLITQGAPGTETRTVVWFIVDEGLRQQRRRPGRRDEHHVRPDAGGRQHRQLPALPLPGRLRRPP